MLNNFDIDDQVGAIIKDILEVYAKHDVDYITGVGVAMMLARAGMLGLKLTPEDAKEFFQSAAKIYEETYTINAEDIDEHQHNCDTCSNRCAESTIPQDGTDDIPSFPFINLN